MNIYRQLAENVQNPRVQSGEDIQRMLDLMDNFQSGPVTSNINNPNMQPQGYSGQSAPQAPAMEGQMSDDPDAMSVLGYSIFGIPSQAGKAAFPPPTTTIGKAISKLGSPVMNYFTGIPNFFLSMAMRQFANPLMSFIENQLGLGPQAQMDFGFGSGKGTGGIKGMNAKQVAMALAMSRGMDLSSPPAIGDIFSINQGDTMGMGPGTGGLGSESGIGPGDAGEGMGMY